MQTRIYVYIHIYIYIHWIHNILSHANFSFFFLFVGIYIFFSNKKTHSRTQIQKETVK